MKKPFKKILSLSAVAIIITMSIGAPAWAADTKTTTQSTAKTSSDTQKATDISSGVTQSFNAGSGIQLGMIVELKAKDSSTVVPLVSKDIKQMLGVVIPNGNAAIVISPNIVKDQQVLVARSGQFNVLVSNQNGPIKAGDYLTISSVDGVAMKADGDQELLLGRAEANFNGTSNVIGSMALKDNLKNTVNVSLGRILAEINITHNPSYQQKSDHVPAFLTKISTALVNKPVSAARIYLGLFLIIATTVITANVVFSGIKGGMIAVGRNPLSKKSIIKSLIQTIIAGIIIFVIGVFAVYLLLKL